MKKNLILPILLASIVMTSCTAQNPTKTDNSEQAETKEIAEKPIVEEKIVITDEIKKAALETDQQLYDIMLQSHDLINEMKTGYAQFVDSEITSASLQESLKTLIDKQRTLYNELMSINSNTNYEDLVYKYWHSCFEYVYSLDRATKFLNYYLASSNNEDFTTTIDRIEIANQQINKIIRERNVYLKSLDYTDNDLNTTLSKDFSVLSIENFESPTKPTKLQYVEGEHVIGHGYSDEGRNEPKYVDLNGFVTAYHNENRDLSQDNNYINTPWQIPIYEKTTYDTYTICGSIDHKTPIKVISQSLEHEGWGTYEGYLYVMDTNTNATFYMDVSNFSPIPYWEYDNPTLIPYVGYCIAEYHQKSDIPPVNRDNEPIELEDGTKVLVAGKTESSSKGPKEKFHPIKTFYINSNYGSIIYFNLDDITIIY